MSLMGADVSKGSLTCSVDMKVRNFSNDEEGWSTVIKESPHVEVCLLEATGRHHYGFAKALHAAGIICLVANPAHARKYACSLGIRAKTDRVDAQVLELMAQTHRDKIRAYVPLPPQIEQARDILASRRALVSGLASLKQTRNDVGDPGGEILAVCKAMEASIAVLDKRLAQTLKGFAAYELLLSIPGIGPQCASRLTCILAKGEFASSDSLVAYLGLDPRAFDSGKKRGQRRISRMGDCQTRTALYMGAQAAAQTKTWKDYHQRQKEKGLSTTEATLILARKLVRVAWSVARKGKPFQAPVQEPPPPSQSA